MFLRDNLPLYLKRFLFFIIVIFVFALEYSSSLMPEIFGVKINMLLPVVVAVGVFEKETVGFVYGLIAGCLADITSTSADGLNTFFYAVAGCVAGLMIHYILRKTLIASLLVNFSLCFVYNFGYWFFNVFIPIGDNGLRVLLTKYIISVLISSVIFPLFFFLIKYCGKLTLEIEKKYFG